MDALAVILGITLGIFLIIGIVLLINVYRVVKQVKHVTDSAEKAVANVATASNFMKNSAHKGSNSMIKIIGNIVESVQNNNKNK